MANNYAILFCERHINLRAQEKCLQSFPLEAALPPSVVTAMGRPYDNSH